MTILFGNLGDGETIRAFSVLAAFASLAAIALGGEAERYAQAHRPAVSLTSIPGPEVAGLPQFRLNGVDYAATGSFQPGGQRELVVLRSCGDILGQR